MSGVLGYRDRWLPPCLFVETHRWLDGSDHRYARNYAPRMRYDRSQPANREILLTAPPKPPRTPPIGPEASASCPARSQRWRLEAVQIGRYRPCLAAERVVDRPLARSPPGASCHAAWACSAPVASISELGANRLVLFGRSKSHVIHGLLLILTMRTWWPVEYLPLLLDIFFWFTSRY